MTLGLYFDQHVAGAAAAGLRQRGIDVLTAELDGRKRLTDHQLLQRATSLGRVMVTNDDDFLAIAAERQRHGRVFNGIAFLTWQDIPIGRLIEDLELIVTIYTDEGMVNHIEYLPL